MDPSNLRRLKLRNVLQSLLLLGGMTVLLGVLGWIIAGPEGLVITAVLGTFTILLTLRMSPNLLVNLLGARPLSAAQAPRLVAMVGELASRADLPRPPRLFYLPTPMLQAFTIGHPGEPVIAISDGMLRLLNARELFGVLAHEIAHIQHRDIWLMTLADTVSRMTRLLSIVGLVLVFVSLPFWLLAEEPVPLVAVLLLVFAPTVSVLLQLALSRTREFDADIGAAKLTGDPAGLASALAKLDRQHGRFWERLFLPGRANPEPSLLRTHPSTKERIQRLLALTPEPVRYRYVGPEEALLPDAWPLLRNMHRRPFREFWY